MLSQTTVGLSRARSAMWRVFRHSAEIGHRPHHRSLLDVHLHPGPQRTRRIPCFFLYFETTHGEVGRCQRINADTPGCSKGGLLRTVREKCGCRYEREKYQGKISVHPISSSARLSFAFSMPTGSALRKPINTTLLALMNGPLWDYWAKLHDIGEPYKDLNLGHDSIA